MKDLSYNKFFGGKVSHKDALKERIKGFITDIVMDENKVSEKSFEQVDKIIKEVNDSFTKQMFDVSIDMYNNGKRIRYISEFLFDTYLNTVNENGTSATGGAAIGMGGEVYGIGHEMTNGVPPTSTGDLIESPIDTGDTKSNKEADPERKQPLHKNKIRHTSNFTKNKIGQKSDKKVMNWDSYTKSNLNKITHLK
jgi:hypothetical protein